VIVPLCLKIVSYVPSFVKSNLNSKESPFGSVLPVASHVTCVPDVELSVRAALGGSFVNTVADADCVTVVDSESEIVADCVTEIDVLSDGPTDCVARAGMVTDADACWLTVTTSEALIKTLPTTLSPVLSAALTD
jgi:hypothetical protein